jgi:hypothetical protein
MEAIAATAKKTKKGTFKIDLPNISSDEEIKVLVVVEKVKPNPKMFDYSDIFGKGQKNKIDWLAYQKKIRSEWD